jgi:hypothetical protein
MTSAYHLQKKFKPLGGVKNESTKELIQRILIGLGYFFEHHIFFR